MAVPVKRWDCLQRAAVDELRPDCHFDNCISLSCNRLQPEIERGVTA
jgi:hypothetical protein